MFVALLTAVIEKGLLRIFQHAVLEGIKRLTETNSNQPVTAHRQLVVSLQAKKDRNDSGRRLQGLKE
jgi:hypothetical protein